MAVMDRLIQFVLRGKDELSPEAKKSTEALEELRNEAAALNAQLDSAKGERGLVRDMQATQRALDQSQRVLGQTEQSIKELRQALNDSPDAKGLQQSLKDADREASRLRRQVASLAGDLGEHEKAAKAAGIDTGNLAEEEKRLAREVDSAKKALAANGQQLRELEREQARASRTAAEHASRVGAVREAMASGGRQLLGYAAAFVSLNAVMGLVRSGLGLVAQGIRGMLATGDDFELLDKRMASLMGSVAAGEQATAWIRQFAKDTPLEVAGVTEAFALLKSYGLDPMDGTLQAVVDKNEQLGGGMERLQGIASALGQAYAKQKLQTEEILQLVERGVPVWSLLEKVTGKNAAQLADLASKGRLGRDAIAALINEIGASAKGAAAENMGTLTGLVSNLSDTWTNFLNRIARSGALEYAKQQLAGVADYIEQMDRDGRLDKLAQSLSTAFEQGAEKAKKFLSMLVDINFTKLTDESAAWLSNFGQHLDETQQKLAAFVLPFRTLFNGLTSGLSLVAAGVTQALSNVLGKIEKAASALPNMLGGAKLKTAVSEARGALDALTAGFVAQVEQDGEDLQSALDSALGGVADSTKGAMQEVTEAVRLETVSQADYVRQAVTSMQGALDQISAAKTVTQLRQIGEEMSAAYRRGDISQQEYAAGSVELNQRLKDVGGGAKGMGAAIDGAAASLETLADVQAAISNAKTSVDIRNINAALTKLYNDGAITAAEYNEAVKQTAARQAELKKAVEGGQQAQESKNKADQDAIVTSEQLRRESGKRMEEERRAGDEAMQRRRKESSDAQRDMSAAEAFFGGVMNRARQPLASLSAAALEAFDRLRGIKTADMNIDTSSLDATTDSLERVSEALANVRSAMNNPMMGSLGRWQLDMQEASLKTQQAYLGQQARLQSLLEKYESGALSTRQFESAARGLRRSLSLLDDSDLSSLDSSIRAAQESMEQMGQSTRSTLDSLQDELDTLQGRTEDIERRRFASRRRELEAQLAEANAGGNAEAMANAARALGMLRQIESATAQQRQADEQKARQEQQAKAATPAASPAQAQAQQPAKVIRLEMPGRTAVDVAVTGANDETNLLSILEDAGMRTL